MGFRNMYIAASAGSGKTYQLVNRFVALLSLQQLATGRTEVGKLIAVTFTRKAAGEFKERILAALAEASQSEENARAFWQQRVLPTICNEQNGICPGTELPPIPSLLDFFTTMLRALTDAFSELRLSTLDSLFQQMVSTLAPELGLNGFSALDPAQQKSMNRRSLDLTYLQHSGRPQPELEAAVSNCFQREERQNTPDANIFELVGKYHEAVLNAPDALWGGNADEMSDEQLNTFGLTREDVTPEMPEGEFRETLASLYRNLPPGTPQSWLDFIDSIGNTGGSLAGEPSGDLLSWFQMNNIDLEGLLEARRPLYWRHLLSRTQAIHKLILEFEQRYSHDVRSRGIYSFNDVLQLLRSRMDSECMLLMEERTDARIEHWMLDEFQDTSWAQYDILRDLLVNRAATGDGSVFMVGDAKQSIYQFRGGDPRIFLTAREELFGLTPGIASLEESAQMPLDTSYRSTQPVLDFANELFGQIDNTARNACKPARTTWKKLGYQQHKAAPHMACRAGCAAIYRAERKRKRDNSHPAVAEIDAKDDANLFRAVAGILAEKRPAGTGRAVPGCAILVGSHTQEEHLYKALTLLQPHYGFEGPIVICNDNMVGADSPAGKALTQLFLWLNCPADEASLSRLRLSPLWEALLATFGQQEDALWESLHLELSATGVAGLLHRLANLCPQLTCNDFLQQRFSAWLNAADAFDNAGGTLPEWITAMQALTVREEPQGNAIRIMTTHKAKGLEFDMVILPRLHESAMADRTKVDLLQKRDEHGNPTAVLLCPSKDALQGAPAVHEAVYTPWQAEQEFARFCELYVAVTRAKYATYVIIPTLADDDAVEEILMGKRPGESVTGMMLQLADSYPSDEEGETGNLPIAERILLRGNAHWEQEWLQRHAANAIPATAEAQQEELCFNFPLLLRSTPSGRAAAARQHSQNQKPLAYGSKNTGTNFGTLVHACFEQVGWLAPGELPTFPATEDAEEAAARQAVLQALAEDSVHRLFRRPDNPCRLYREQGIEALRDGNTWVSGQIDRLAVEYADAACTQPLRALIIDFKSDRCEPAALKPEYAPQMREYREMAALAFGLPAESVGVTLIHAPRQGQPCTLPYAEDEL